MTEKINPKSDAVVHCIDKSIVWLRFFTHTTCQLLTASLPVFTMFRLKHICSYHFRKHIAEFYPVSFQI